MSTVTESAQGLGCYDLQIQRTALEQEMEVLNRKSHARIQQNEKLSLFYENELQEWLTRLEKEKIVWQRKRNELSEKCTQLQQCLHSQWSSADANLKNEKDKYYNIVTKLLPEYQKIIERKQMKAISEFESKVSLIQQRRQTADIAFEKEKKLLSLISMRQKQLYKLRNEEKNDALLREYERQTIMQNEMEYSDTLKCRKPNEFVEMRKQITSELEKKFVNEINDIKTKVLHKNIESKEIETAEIAIATDEIMTGDMSDTYESAPNNTEEQCIFNGDDNDAIAVQRIVEEEKDSAEICNAEQQNDSNVSVSDSLELSERPVEDAQESLSEKSTELSEMSDNKQAQSADIEEKKENWVIIEERTEERQVQSKLNRSFNAESSKNRLQFLSVLESPNKSGNASDANESQSNEKISNTNIKALNDFEEVQPITNRQMGSDESSDEFDF